MADLDGIADLLAAGVQGPQGPDDSGFHTGIVRAWDSLTGANTIEVNGVSLFNLRTLRAGIGVSYAVGETVVILRKQTQYFILGRVAAPATGGSSGVRAASLSNTQHLTGNGTTYVTPLASVTVQSYLGKSATALVLMTCRCTLNANVALACHMRMTLANGVVIPPGFLVEAGDGFNYAGNTLTDTSSIDTTIVVNYLATPADGFVPGLTTFKTEVLVDSYGTSNPGADVHQTGITVIPL